MKLIRPIVVLSASFFINANVLAKPVSIKGKFSNMADYKYVYLYDYFGTINRKVDSVAHKGGSFEFKFKSEMGRGLYKIGISEDKSGIVIAGNESFSVAADVSSFSASFKVSGSKENDLFYQYRVFNDRHNQEVQNLQKQAQQYINERNTNPAKYEWEMGKLQQKLDSMNVAQLDFYTKVVKENPDLFIAKIINMFTYDAAETPENFFRKEYFTDPELLRGDMLMSKVSNYLQRFAQPNLDSWKTSFANILSAAPEGSQGREIVYMSLIQLIQPYDAEYARKLALAYDQEFKSYYSGYTLASVPKGKPEVGEEAPDFTLTSPDGKPLSLSSLRGKIVLLDFWASWCGPCRMENPNVVRAYEKYKDKGFTVFNVSLDNNKEKWVQAIQKDQLSWDTHVSDLKGWQSPVVNLYHVKGIPSTFLIDKDGKIIATNLRGASLEEMLEKVCK